MADLRSANFSSTQIKRPWFLWKHVSRASFFSFFLFCIFLQGILKPKFTFLVDLTAGTGRASVDWVVQTIQTQSHCGNLFQQTGLSPLARYIEKVSVECRFWGPCCDIYRSSLFSCRCKHIHAIINQSRIGMGLRLVPLAQLSHTGSRQRWSDCRLIWSQNSVAPQYCKWIQLPVYWKQAGKWRQCTACQYLEAPCWWLMLCWGTFTHNGLKYSVGQCVCQWRRHSWVRWRICDQLSLSTLNSNAGSWGMCVSVHMYVWWPWWCRDSSCFTVHTCSSSTSRYLARQAAVERNNESKRKSVCESTAKNEKQMLNSTQGYEDASFSQGSEVVFNFLHCILKGYIIWIYFLVMDKEISDTQVHCRYLVFLSLGWPFSSCSCLASLQSSLRMP